VDLDLVFIGVGDIPDRCRQPRREVMELVSAVVGEKKYGATIEFLGVNVVLQDTGLIKLGTRVFRKRKEAAVDVELSKQWIKNASDSEIKLALLGSLLEAVDLVGKKLTRKGDDFDAQALIADLQILIDDVREDVIGEGVSIRELDVRPRGHQAERFKEIEEHKVLIVQYRTEKALSPGDLEQRQRVENVLDECLKQTGNGYCDGGDIGDGTINVFLHVLDLDHAIETIVEALSNIHLLDGAMIALETEEGFKVLWPQEFVGGFSYSY